MRDITKKLTGMYKTDDGKIDYLKAMKHLVIAGLTTIALAGCGGASTAQVNDGHTPSYRNAYTIGNNFHTNNPGSRHDGNMVDKRCDEYSDSDLSLKVQCMGDHGYLFDSKYSGTGWKYFPAKDRTLMK